MVLSQEIVDNNKIFMQKIYHKKVPLHTSSQLDTSALGKRYQNNQLFPVIFHITKQ